MVDKAFAMMDKDRSGYVNFSDVAAVYDVSKDKDFIAGKKTKQ